MKKTWEKVLDCIGRESEQFEMFQRVECRGMVATAYTCFVIYLINAVCAGFKRHKLVLYYISLPVYAASVSASRAELISAR